jgi:hypothetical protein
MRVYGIDFTSRPRRGKPIMCLACKLDGHLLRAERLSTWTELGAFEAALRRPGPWIAGIDCPFGQARRFVEDIGWPRSWEGYVQTAATLGRDGFRVALDAYRLGRLPGQKEHRRVTDVVAGAISPQKLYGTPVGLMFFEGAPRLLAAGVTIPGLREGDPERIAVEVYPGLLARTLIGRTGYKQDIRSKQTAAQAAARRELLNKVTGGTLRPLYGLSVEAPVELAEDPCGDQLDALLCAIQAAWAWTRRGSGFGLPGQVDPLEGWIVDPKTLEHFRAPGCGQSSAGSR